jgi:ABC-type lipoprotein release transport system permease subunit
MGEDAHAIVVSGASYETIPKTKAAVAAQLAPDSRLVVLDWEQLIPGLKQLIQTDMVQNWITYIALILIVTLSIMNTFLMSVLERTREFGIMLALGSARLGGGAAGVAFTCSVWSSASRRRHRGMAALRGFHLPA